MLATAGATLQAKITTITSLAVQAKVVETMTALPGFADCSPNFPGSDSASDRGEASAHGSRSPCL